MTGSNLGTEEHLCYSILSKIARLEACDVDALPPLYDVLDPEALAAVLRVERMDQGGVSVTFRYCGYRVKVTSAGEITIE
ncbi:HalOD1 output domain-containing protein [Haloferacaceae archaeon DSL9]